MSKQVYISADYSPEDGDRDVVDELHKWSKDNYHVVDYCDTAQVVSGSVSEDEDCRACDLKREFNSQINASSAVIFIIGDKTADRTAGSSCLRNSKGAGCPCTPYKMNANGSTTCKIYGETHTPGLDEDLGRINTYSYLEHEFKQAKRKKKSIIVVYNSVKKQPSWLPPYMKDYADEAHPFWTYDASGKRVGDYAFIKQALGYE